MIEDFPETRVKAFQVADKIKEKYPIYKDIDPSFLAKRITEKWPEFSNSIVNYNEYEAGSWHEWNIQNYLNDKAIPTEKRQNAVSDLNSWKIPEKDLAELIVAKYSNAHSENMGKS